MNRRELIAFIASVAGLGVFGNESMNENPGKKHVIVELTGTPEWDKALETGLAFSGGISSYVARKSRVLIKPSLAWNRNPGTGYNSDPLLVKALIDACYKAGAREVSLFDNAFDDWAITYRNSGIERIAKDSGARVIPANDFRYYIPIETTSTDGKKLHIHKAVANADVVINLPAVYLKNDRPVNGSLFNYLGCLWERGSCLLNEYCLERLILYKKPVLTISETGSFTHNLPNPKKALIISSNLIAPDVLAAKWLNIPFGHLALLENAMEIYPGLIPIDDVDIEYISK